MSSFLEFIPFDLSDYYINGIRYQHIISKIATNISNYSNESMNYYMNYYMNYNMNYNYILLILSTLALCFITSIYIIKWTKQKQTHKQTNTDKTNTTPDNNEKHNEKELYNQSILEVLSKNKDIIPKMKVNDDYWVLLRVVMKNPLRMRHTKYELHSNNIGNISNKAFTTQDMFMIIKMKYYNSSVGKENNQIKFNMANSIIRCMNYLNNISNEEYKTKDFIVVAIGNTNVNVNNNVNVNSNEFYNGLINNNYELFNYRDVIIKVDVNKNTNVGFILMLPIHKVYDIFMDVYNNTLFESKKYEMDNENYESWNGKSINELHF
jgi:hypothetical protein